MPESIKVTPEGNETAPLDNETTTEISLDELIGVSSADSEEDFESKKNVEDISQKSKWDWRRRVLAHLLISAGTFLAGHTPAEAAGRYSGACENAKTAISEIDKNIEVMEARSNVTWIKLQGLKKFIEDNGVKLSEGKVRVTIKSPIPGTPGAFRGASMEENIFVSAPAYPKEVNIAIDEYNTAMQGFLGDRLSISQERSAKTFHRVK